MTPDRPLTDAQEQTLIHLADRAPAWLSDPARDVRTLKRLEQLGLADYRFAGGYGMGRWEARITDAGLAMVNSMGD